eukprot:413997-Hanusia_phi.AAC.1
MQHNITNSSSSLGCSNKNRNNRKRALNPQFAADIFAQRSFKPGYASVESNFVARKFGISSKTVRDIWGRRTWIEATRPLWTVEEQDAAEKAEAGKKFMHNRVEGSKPGLERSSSSVSQDTIEAKDMTEDGTGSLQANGWSSSTTSIFTQTSEESSDELSCMRIKRSVVRVPSSPISTFQLQPEASLSGCTGSGYRDRREERAGCSIRREERQAKRTMERKGRNENANPSSSDAHNETSSETGSGCRSGSSAGQESRTQRKQNENKRSRESHACTRCYEAEQPSQGSLERQLPSQQSK